ncbi:hypothetical protein HZP94_08310 [Elizabethkingia anophelis]|nr:hypothetical protein [Elizabethkingia anophelis]MCT4062934.1 hypothetical protein [Elizabethkingia anophelis]MCT4109226.1 hypothetical protein [Elizabethkingia anophelis]
MKKILFTYFIILLSIFSTIKAQAVSLSDVPESKWSWMYLKDIDNTLPQFTGIWKAQFEGNEITLDISDKVEKFPIRGLSIMTVMFCLCDILSKPIQGNNWQQQ